MILDKIIASTKIRVAKAKENLSPSGLLKALDKAELKAPNFKKKLHLSLFLQLPVQAVKLQVLPLYLIRQMI